jgi:glycosyltransferase involved in cell wall biosynthesis
MKKKKLAYVLHGLSLGGVEVALVSAVPRLHQEFDLKIVCLGAIDPLLIAHLTPAEKAVFISLPASPVRFFLTWISAVRFILRFNPDLLLCSLWRASLVGFTIKRLSKQIKLFSFIHNTRFFHLPDQICTTLAVKSADEILVDSKATSLFVSTHFKSKTPIRIISFFTHQSPKRRSNRPLDLNTKIKFIYLGRFDPVKNIPMAVDVIGHLRSKSIDASLDLFGQKTDYWNDVECYIKKSGLEFSVQYKGELPPPLRAKIFSGYHFLIQLSEVEGMAMSVAEAMQHGLVCVVTPVGEIPNYSRNMESALFVKTGNNIEWESSLNDLERVISQPELYESISIKCWSNFQSVETYTNSLLQCITD